MPEWVGRLDCFDQPNLCLGVDFAIQSPGHADSDFLDRWILSLGRTNNERPSRECVRGTLATARASDTVGVTRKPRDGQAAFRNAHRLPREMFVRDHGAVDLTVWRLGTTMRRGRPQSPRHLPGAGPRRSSAVDAMLGSVPNSAHESGDVARQPGSLSSAPPQHGGR